MATFWGTRRVRQTGKDDSKSSRIVYIDKTWGIPSGCNAWVTIRRLRDGESCTSRSVKSIRSYGCGQRFTVDKNLDLNVGEWVVYSVTPIEWEPKDDDDTGVETEE